MLMKMIMSTIAIEIKMIMKTVSKIKMFLMSVEIRLRIMRIVATLKIMKEIKEIK